MLLDETCFFLAIDFDKVGWQDDTLAVLTTCGRLDLSVALERSRSATVGTSGCFFEDPVPAALARKLGCHISTETMEHRPEIGSTRTIASFPIKTRCHTAGWAT